MFHDFYQMLEEPFGVAPDPRFLYTASSHREALASLYYGIQSDRGVMVLIAPPGSGKTTLIHQLIGKLKQQARTVFLFQTQCNSSEMLQYLLNDLGVDVNGMQTVAMHNHLKQILTQERAAGRRFILIVDEAQNLQPGVLETIRLLSNFETSRHKLLQIVLVGQPELARKLATPALDQLQQRISICTRLRPFDPEETAGYIAHRLKVAGYSGNELFTPAALAIIAKRSRGIPRSVNRLCFSALTLGCAMSRDQIDASMVEEVLSDLEGARTVPQPAGEISAPATGAIRRQWRPQSRDLKIAGAAATVLVALGGLDYAGSRTGQPGPARTAIASPAIATPRAKPPLAEKPLKQASSPSPAPANRPALIAVKPHPMLASEQAFEPVSPVIAPEQSTDETTPDVDANTVKVVVRPGETLQRIALRTLGHDNTRLIRQIQELNPQLKNPDHIEADQELRLPQVPPESPSVSP